MAAKNGKTVAIYAGKERLQSKWQVVYGTSWCGYCTKTKNLLKTQGVSFEDKDIEKDTAARREMEAKMAQAGLKSSGGVPVIDFYGRIMVGYNEGLLLELCQNQGKK